MDNTFNITRAYKDKLDGYLYDLQKAAQKEQKRWSLVENLCMSIRGDLAELETMQ